MIDVSDAESLHRVAERFDTVVLHHAGADEDIFAVRDVDATYRFVVPAARTAGAASRRSRPPARRPEDAPRRCPGSPRTASATARRLPRASGASSPDRPGHLRGSRAPDARPEPYFPEVGVRPTP